MDYVMAILFCVAVVLGIVSVGGMFLRMELADPPFRTDKWYRCFLLGFIVCGAGILASLGYLGWVIVYGV